MSMQPSYYTIIGYDLSSYYDELYTEDFANNEEEKWACNQSEGNIQLFTDPCSGEHLYFGRVIGDGDYYDYKSSVFDLSKLQDEEPIIKNTLLEVFPNIEHIPQISVICFCEWR